MGDGVTPWQALVGEIAGIFLLMYVVLETAVNPRSAANSVNAPIAIGFAVYLAHSVLIPIDGCSINPTRSIGSAVVATIRGCEDMEKAWKFMWIAWVGPLAGAALAVAVYALLNS